LFSFVVSIGLSSLNGAGDDGNDPVTIKGVGGNGGV